jgi:hypothetical protein
MRSTVTTAAHLVLYANGKPLGQVSSFAWTFDSPHRAIRTIDLLAPAEFAPTGTSVSGRIGLFRRAKDGGADGAGLTVPTVDTARGRYVTLLLLDRRTDLPVFRADKARVTQQAWTVGAKGLVTGIVAFEAFFGQGELNPAASG